MQRPCRVQASPRLCRVKVKLTMRFAAAESAARVRLRFRGFSRFLRDALHWRRQTDWSSLATGRGGDIPDLREADKATSDEGGCSQHPPFTFFSPSFATQVIQTKMFAPRTQGYRRFGPAKDQAIVHLHRLGKGAYFSVSP